MALQEMIVSGVSFIKRIDNLVPLDIASIFLSRLKEKEIISNKELLLGRNINISAQA